MTDERPYDAVGREPLEDEALEAAIVAYRTDNPGADDHLLRSVETRLRRLNDEARQEAAEAARVQSMLDQAADDGIALSWADAAAALRKQDEAAGRERAELAQRQAKQYAAQEARRPRLPGRKAPSRTVGREQIIETFRALRQRLKRNPTQPELVANLEPKISVRTLSDMLTVYGLSWPIE